MRLIFALPAIAAMALTACSNSAEEEVGAEELSASEVLAAADEAGIVPRPGEYENTSELLEFSLAGMPADRLELVKQAFAEGAAQKATYCVTEEMTSEQWLSEMAESDCTVSRFEAADGKLDMAMSCASEDGLSGRVAMSGTASEEGSNMEMTFQQDIPNMGDAQVKVRVQSQRIGDCG